MIQIVEPVMVNPNSFVNVQHIFDEHKNLNRIISTHTWVVLGHDGPPYLIASKLVEANAGKYDWLCLVPGLRHLHMNQLKIFLKVQDYLMLESLGKDALHSSLPKANQYPQDLLNSTNFAAWYHCRSLATICVSFLQGKTFDYNRSCNSGVALCNWKWLWA